MDPDNMFCWLSYRKGSVPGPLATCNWLIHPQKLLKMYDMKSIDINLDLLCLPVLYILIVVRF